jgi:porphobilinogen synthase
MKADSLLLDTRPRRLRKTPWMRNLVQETRPHVSDLIWPLFVHDAPSPSPIKALPGAFRHSIDSLVAAAQKAHDLGIPAIAIFPVVGDDKKSELADEAFNPDNLACRAIAQIKVKVPEIGVIADVALDPYTAHGHDGVLVNGEIDNDATVALLCQQATTLAAAGADIIAPSDMMDGRVGAIRQQLDMANFEQVAILSYAVKYASALYAPFRAAVGSGEALKSADKKTYQMNPANIIEALQEGMLDAQEGADMLMVKPASLYLDVISQVKEASLLPVFAYHVSGEYAMLAAAASQGLLDFDAVLLETLISIKRAGAQAILTYGAMDIAAKLSA